ncbi:hypothetical protein ScPMuIL_005766 [Solemya velum]
MEVIQKVKGILEPLGFEAHPFKIGWYNEVVDDIFHFPYDDDVVAFLVVSTPAMFDKAFKPYICDLDFTEGMDVIDDCISSCMTRVQEAFPEEDVEIIKSSDILHSRRPRVLVQSAAHVSGAAYFYRRGDVEEDPWEEKQKIAGVCIHPKYGGWMGLRGVIIFRSFHFPSLQSKASVDCLKTRDRKIDLLNKFNFHWRDKSYRDVIGVKERYSDEQNEFFDTPSRERGKLIELIKKNWKH